MDGQQFDRYVQSLGQTMSRRGVLVALAGLAAAEVSAVTAKKHKKQRGKRRRQKQGNGQQQAGAGDQAVTVSNGAEALLGGADASCLQQHKSGWCHCTPKKHCNVICIDYSATEPSPYDDYVHDAHGDHPGDYFCAVDTACYALKQGDRCSGCGPNTRRFTQNFERNTKGWFTVTGGASLERVPADTKGIPADSGGWFVMLPDEDQEGSNFTRWGTYGSLFPSGGYTTEVAIYLDPRYLGQDPVDLANDTRFDWTSAINTPHCSFRRDFVFNVGYYTDSDATGSGPRYVISGGNNAYRHSSNPKNPGHDPIAITSGGWYTFQHVFYDFGDGTLAVDLKLFDANGSLVHTWTLNDKSDVIGDTVGGNRYGWFPVQEFPFLAIDTSSYRLG